jgi:non-canonical purine NTP pyrophosphatase (RdgB/HAM1 family)
MLKLLINMKTMQSPRPAPAIMDVITLRSLMIRGSKLMFFKVDQAFGLTVKKLLEELKGVPLEKRTARFVCHLAFVMEGVLIHTVGTLEGTIAIEPSGRDGFGYDPIFIPTGYQKSLSELGQDIKNKISHRARAVDALMQEIAGKEIVIAKP